MAYDIALKEKEAFYGQLDVVDASFVDDDHYLGDGPRSESRRFFQQGERGRHSSEREQVKNIAEKRQLAGLTAGPSPKSPVNEPTAGTNASPIVVESTPAPLNRGIQKGPPRAAADESSVKDTPLRDTVATVTKDLRRQLIEPATGLREISSSGMASTSSRKRTAKGKVKEDVVPEDRKVLRGLSLFYVPSQRIGLRKQRMEHAERYGAVVAKQLSDATHIVVDHGLKYDDIKAIISDGSLKASTKIVKDQWPLDCIQHGRVFPATPRYSIRGMPAEGWPGEQAQHKERPVQTADAPVTQTSDKSLELKAPSRNPKRWDYVPTQTPSQCQTASIPSTPIGDGHDLSNLQNLSGQKNTKNDGVVIFSVVEKEDQRRARNAAEMPPATGIESGDELSQILIDARQQFKDLPPIGDEDAVLNPGGDGETDDSDTSEENERKKAKTGTKEKSKDRKKNSDEYFACYRGGTEEQILNQDNPNAPTIAVFKQMLEYYTQTNDHWRILAYRKCIGILSKITDRKIMTAEQAMELPCFGKRLSTKLEEIVQTHALARLEYALEDPLSRVLTLFLGIYGVGKTTADRWIAKGFRTLDDLRQRADLSDAQRVGIDHYDDLNTGIPRAEVTMLAACVTKEASRIDPSVEFVIGGSYRRGAETSNDIDLIVTKGGTTSSNDLVPFLDKLVDGLESQGFLTAALASSVSSSSHHSKTGASKWHGCCVLPRIPGYNDDASYRPVWRRIDLLLVPETEYGAALIYFTGNDIFNRSIRLLASRKGMRLNQRGLYKDAIRGSRRQKVAEGELLEGRSEKRIFKILGVQWREPSQRWC